MKTNNKAGFSLIELLVALSILAVVAAIIVPRFLNVRQSAASTTAAAQAKTIAHTIQQWVSLGGACTATDGTVAASQILQFLSTANGGNARTTAGGCSDSSGSFGSGSVGLQLTNVTSGTQGFTWTAGTSATYNDGAGSTYTIKVIPSNGYRTYFTGTPSGTTTAVTLE